MRGVVQNPRRPTRFSRIVVRNAISESRIREKARGPRGFTGTNHELPKPKAFGSPKTFGVTNPAFTLVELITVIAIISLLAGLVIGTYSYAQRKKLDAKTRSQLYQITLALELYNSDYNSFPVTTSNAPRANAISHVLDAGTSSNNLVLYRALTNYTYSGGKSAYLEIRSEQVDASGYFVDPYRNVWGYFNAINPSHRTNQFNQRTYDLWSFGKNPNEPTNSLICNWRQQ